MGLSTDVSAVVCRFAVEVPSCAVAVIRDDNASRPAAPNLSVKLEVKLINHPVSSQCLRYFEWRAVVIIQPLHVSGEMHAGPRRETSLARQHSESRTNVVVGDVFFSQSSVEYFIPPRQKVRLPRLVSAAKRNDYLIGGEASFDETAAGFHAPVGARAVIRMDF